MIFIENIVQEGPNSTPSVMHRFTLLPDDHGQSLVAFAIGVNEVFYYFSWIIELLIVLP